MKNVKLYTGKQYICSSCFLLSHNQLVLFLQKNLSSTSIFFDTEYSFGHLDTCFLKQNTLLVKCVKIIFKNFF